MEQKIAHRGPDEGHVWSDENCGLAHRRLRVIDLSPRAAQPMVDAQTRRVVVFNGEIYNFRTLRAELEALGYAFQSQSDTEVLLHGYERWGEKLFAKLRGMFAFALWEPAARRLVFARDGLGKKPFFFSVQGDAFVFGSELAVFRDFPGLTRSICPESFREYVEFGYVSSPRTIFREIRQLTPGCWGAWDGRGLTVQPYYTLPVTLPPSSLELPENEADETVEKALFRAVKSRLVSDVPLGCFLSSGIDSSLIAALACQASAGKLKTYTVGFTDSVETEATAAGAIARHLGTEHHEIAVSGSALLAEFPEILARTAEPLGDDSFLPTYVISRETKREVSVALSGDGGDELFCGYDKYRQFAAARRLQARLPKSLLRKLHVLGRLPVGDRWNKSLEAASTESAPALARWLSTLWKRSEISHLLDATAGDPNGADPFAAAWARRPDFSEIERFMLTDMETYLVGDILTKVDRASMAVGLEVRSPFLELDLIHEAFRFPARANPARGGKAILRRLLARHLPEKLFERPKRGFGMPIEQWYRGPLRHILLEYTSAARVRNRGLLNNEALQSAVRDHLSGRRNFARKLHAVVAFEIWAEHAL